MKVTSSATGSDERTTKAGVQTATVCRQGYEASVKARALARAGNNANLHGHIQEIMAADKTNLNPINGLKETLTQSTTANTVDSVVCNSKGAIVQRVQYKDVRDVGKLVRQCKDGKYATATLKGSPETAKAFNAAAEKAGIAKRMQSTGVSSKTTTSLAKSCGAGHAGTLGKALSASAQTGAWAGGVGAACFSGVSNLCAIVNNEKSVGEAMGAVAKDTGIGVVSGAAASASATAAGAAAATVVATLGLTGAAATATVLATPLVAAVAVGWAVSSFFSRLFK